MLLYYSLFYSIVLYCIILNYILQYIFTCCIDAMGVIVIKHSLSTADIYIYIYMCVFRCLVTNHD